MNVLLAIVGLPVALVLPGLVTLVAWAPGFFGAAAPRPAHRADWLERAYLTLALSLLLSGWVGLILAQVGLFSAGLLVGLLAAYTLVVGLIGWRKGRWGKLRWPLLSQCLWPWARANASSLLFLLLSIVFIALAFRPFELILGPRDAAVYPATAVQIARHGSIRIADPLLTTLPDPALSDENNRTWTSLILIQSAGRFYYHYLRMPGFFIAEEAIERAVPIPEFIPNAAEGVVVPQFYHLYPTWLALAFGLVGIQAGLLMTPYLSFLGGVGVFVVTRRLLGAPAALLAALFLNLNVLQVWFARYSTAEGATQFVIFLCLYAFVRLEEDDAARREPFWGLLMGAALGLIGLVRVEFIFPWALFLPYLAYLYVTRGLRRGHRYLLLAWGVLVAHTLVQFVTHTRGYTLAIYYHRIQDWFTLSWLTYPFMTPTLRLYFFESDTSRTLVMKEPWRLVYELGVPLLVVAGLVWLRRRPAWVGRIGAWLRRHGRRLLTAAALLLLAALLYGYLVRPGILRPEVLRHPVAHNLTLQGYIGAPVPAGPAANLVRLGWYLSPLGMALAFAGSALLVAREANRRAWFLTLLGLFYLFLFTYETFGMDHHVYIMRRYVAVVVPFFCVAAAYAVAWLGSWLLPGGAAPPSPPGVLSRLRRGLDLGLYACTPGSLRGLFAGAPPLHPAGGPAAPQTPRIDPFSAVNLPASESGHRSGPHCREYNWAGVCLDTKGPAPETRPASTRERFYAGGPGDCKSPGGGAGGGAPGEEKQKPSVGAGGMGGCEPPGAAGRRATGPTGRARRAAAAALALLLCVYLAYTGRPFFRHNEYAGALDQVAALAERFEPDDVILAVGGARDAPFTIVTPLRYLFERHAFGIVANQPPGALLEGQIRRWQAEGRRVYLLVGNGGGRLLLPHTRLEWVDRFELAVPEFEQLTAQKPHNAYTLRQAWGIYEPVAWTGPGSALAGLPVEVDLGRGGYIFQAGGFYGDETAPDGTTYCWTTGQGVLRLPWPEEGAVAISLRLAGGKRPEALGPAVVHLQGDQYLFDVGLDSAAGLDQGEVSAGLREQFQESGHALSPKDPVVEIRQAGRAWAIFTEDTRYLVRKGPQSLHIYVEQVLGSWELGTGFTTHTLLVPAAAVTPDEHGNVLLTIVSPPWKQIDHGLGNDTRPLGVEVDWVRVGQGEK